MVELMGQIEALKEKLVEATAKEIYPFNMPQWENLPEEDCWKDNELFGKSRQVGKATYRYHARQQLAEELPEERWLCRRTWIQRWRCNEDRPRAIDGWPESDGC